MTNTFSTLSTHDTMTQDELIYCFGAVILFFGIYAYMFSPVYYVFDSLPKQISPLHRIIASSSPTTHLQVSLRIALPCVPGSAFKSELSRGRFKGVSLASGVARVSVTKNRGAINYYTVYSRKFVLQNLEMP